MSRSIRSQLLGKLAIATALAITCGIAGAYAQNAQKVSLRMDWVISAYHTPFFGGVKNGYYKE
jgi:ABC-type nitrate/sulfonate/bicarbonate transport system substrate-binding protein